MATVKLDERPNFIRASAGSILGRLALVKRDIASPDRTGFYRGEIAVLEEARDFSIDLLFANGDIAKRFDITRATQGKRLVFSWDGWANDRPIDHQLLRVTTRGIRSVAIFVWAAIVAVRVDSLTSDPIFCTAIGEFRTDDIVRVGNHVGLRAVMP